MRQGEKRVGLVLAAGGVLGGAWIAGGLAGLGRATGWHPRSAHRILGTSAGAVFAALCASGIRTDQLLPHTSEGLAADSSLLVDLAAEATYRVPSGLPNPLPGSWRLTLSGLNGLFSAGGWSALKALSGLLPRGSLSTVPIQRTVQRAQPRGWPRRPACWIVACDYETGERVVFGRQASPSTNLARAVAASCAVPGLFRPVRIGGRQYVDGGLHSMSNLDLLRGEGLDLVLCLSPLTAPLEAASWDPRERLAVAMRWAAQQQLRREVGVLLDAGTQVVVLEPGPAEAARMGLNLMDATRCWEVSQGARHTVMEQLARPELRDLLRMLPAAA